ncbi:uncharacterized protein LOC129774172 [Toxorhynchites rutilus septentrionalis]|uniref:uncharacterized protein LOC129774172 n=1 Tax=Toxorhynchites rutilus septentrionalis TaxID=329112 RepID=UPI0024785B29|nr:uncharacterized protein LOC129774172 [Toxorhynchites rutilus septentrionalis]
MSCTRVRCVGWSAVAFIAVAGCVFNARDCNLNYTEPAQAVHWVQKRFVPFIPNGGVAKVLFTAALPVKFQHKTKRSLSWAHNLQANYAIPGRIIWPLPESYFKARLDEGSFVDNSRVQLYRILEKMVDSWNNNGRGCLLRTICEVADTPLKHNGLVGEILDVIFTPSEADRVDLEYKLASRYGANGVDCGRLYKECLAGYGLLDELSTVLVT